MSERRKKTSSDRLVPMWTETSFGQLHAVTNRHEPPAGPPLILIHGFVISSTYMVPLAHLIAPRCRVYAVDLPGYGASDRPNKTPSPADLGHALAEWMERNRIPAAHLLGNSYGCQILAHFAVHHPSRVDRLVLQGPTIDPYGRSIARQMIRLQLTARYEDDTIGKVARHDYLRAGLKQILHTTRYAFADRIEEILPHIQAPTLIVRGGNDHVVSPRWAEEATRLLRRGKLRTVPGAGHALNFSHPVELTRVIEPFLNLPDEPAVAA